VRSGNNIPIFAQAINLYHKQWFTNSDDIVLDKYLSSKMMSGNQTFVENGIGGRV